MNEDAKHSAHYTVADIRKYLAGELSPAEMHAMEKAALDDPFLADAMEGMQSLQTSGNASFEEDVAALKQRLQNRAAGKKRYLIYFSNRRWWQVAAVVLVVVAIGITYPYLFKQTGRPAVIAATKQADSVHALSDASAAAPATEAMKEQPAVRDETAAASPAPPEDLHPNTASRKKKRRDAGITVDVERKAAGVATTDDQPVAANKVQSAPSAAIKPAFKDTGKRSEPVAEAEKTDTSKNSALAGQPQGNAHLDEVVVIGYGGRSRKAFGDKGLQNAEPAAGWEAYRKYLKENRRSLQDSLKGEVIVSFRIKKDGKLSGFNIEKSLRPDYDAEAIRLIKEGPPWKVLKGKKTRTTVAVEF